MPYSSLRPILSTSIEGIRRKKEEESSRAHDTPLTSRMEVNLTTSQKQKKKSISSTPPFLFPILTSPLHIFYIFCCNLTAGDSRTMLILWKQSLCFMFRYFKKTLNANTFTKCDSRDQTVDTAGCSSLLSSVVGYNVENKRFSGGDLNEKIDTTFMTVKYEATASSRLSTYQHL